MRSFHTIITVFSAAIVIVVVNLLASFTAALPGSNDPEQFYYTSCGEGCRAGLLVMAGAIAIASCFLVCCCTWRAPELKIRVLRRAAARKNRDTRVQREMVEQVMGSDQENVAAVAVENKEKDKKAKDDKDKKLKHAPDTKDVQADKKTKKINEADNEKVVVEKQKTKSLQGDKVIKQEKKVEKHPELIKTDNAKLESTVNEVQEK